jgi:hypothetical protein
MAMARRCPKAKENAAFHVEDKEEFGSFTKASEPYFS